MILKRTLKPEKPSKSATVESVQRMLSELGFNPEGIDGIFGKKTEKAVIRFQESAGLYSDGIVGPVTMEALEQAYTALVLETMSPGIESVDGHEERMQFVRCEADKLEGTEGYDRLYLRQDAAEAYNKVLDQVRQWGGKLTSSGGKRALNANLNSNRSATSFHYLGLALDLFVWSGMVKPEEDPYVIRVADLEARSFEVYVRCNSNDVEKVTLSDVVAYKDPGLRNRLAVTGRFKNLTAEFHKHGFEPIPARLRFIEDGYPLAAEWWHFQFEAPLRPYVSNFGGELLKVYSKQRLENTAPWRFRDRVFKVNWS